MVDEIVTRQELIDAKRDAQDLGKAVNEKVIVSPRYGDDFKSLPMIADEFQDAIETAAAAGAGENGWTDLLIQTADGSTQRAKNASFQAQIDSKADTAYVNAQDASLQAQINDKANKAYVDSQDSALQSQIDQKATEAYLDSALAEQTQAVNTALSQLSTAASKFYPTLTEANADIVNLEVNQPVQVGESGANGGLWYKATAGATSLTKSDYDSLTQAKAQIIKGINNVAGKYFHDAKYEHDGSALYVKLNESAGNTFFIRAANIPTKEILLTAATAQLQEYFSSDKYPVTAPSGATGYFKLTNVDCIVYDQDAERLRGVARTAITPNSNYALMISNNYTQVGLGIERDIALMKIEASNRIKYSQVQASQQLRMIALAPTSGTYHTSIPARLRSAASGQVIFDSETKILYIPSATAIFRQDQYTYTSLGSGHAVDLSTVLASTNFAKVYYDHENASFVVLAASQALTATQSQKYALFAAIRYSSSSINIECDFDYRIDVSNKNTDLSSCQCAIVGAYSNSSAYNHITYKTAQREIVLPKDLILVFNGMNYALPSDTTLSFSGLNTTGFHLYWNIVKNELVVKTWAAVLTAFERYRFVRVLSVRDRNALIATTNPQAVVVDCSAPYYVDDRPFNILSNSVTEMRLDDSVKAPNHRGYNSVAPENTLPAYILSKKKGYSYVECDISFTSDGVPVLLHDGTVDRTSNGTGSITDLTLAQVKELDFGSWKSADYAGTKIPTLEEFLQLCHRLNLHPYMELKTTTYIDASKATLMLNLVKKTGMYKRVSFISYGISQLTAMKNVDDSLRLGLVCDSVTQTVIDNAVSLKSTNNIVFVDADHRYMTKEIAGGLIDVGVDVEVFSPNSAALIPALADMGVTGISTDYLNIREILNNS